MPGSRPGRRRAEKRHPAQPHPYAGLSTAWVATIFGLACLVTLAAGVALEESGNVLANRLGVNGVIFGATILAGATALPEISSGIAAVRLGDHALAMGDIFGGNAFQVCLFLVADLVAGTPVLPSAGPPQRVACGARSRADRDLRLRRDQSADAYALRDSARIRCLPSLCSASASPGSSTSRTSRRRSYD